MSQSESLFQLVSYQSLYSHQDFLKESSESGLHCEGTHMHASQSHYCIKSGLRYSQCQSHIRQKQSEDVLCQLSGTWHQVEVYGLQSFNGSGRSIRDIVQVNQGYNYLYCCYSVFIFSFQDADEGDCCSDLSIIFLRIVWNSEG